MNTIKQKTKSKDREYQYYEKIPEEEECNGFKGKDQKNYIFLPAYVEIEPKEFSCLSLLKQNFKFRGRVTIKLPKFPLEIKQHLQNSLKILLFENKIPVVLSQTERKITIQNDGALSWTYEINQKVSWKPHLAYIPFDGHLIPIHVELAHFKIGKNQYYFNILNKVKNNEKKHWRPWKEMYVRELENFLLYFYQPRYIPLQRNIGGKKVKYSPQITLNFYLVRSLISGFFTILLPNFVLQLLSVIIFFTDNDFGPRVTNITVLILAIVTFMSSIRPGLPYIPYITLMDFILYTAVINLGLCMLETSLKRHNPDYSNRVLLIIACCLVFLTTLISGIFILYRMCEFLKMRLMEMRTIQKESDDKTPAQGSKIMPADDLLRAEVEAETRTVDARDAGIKNANMSPVIPMIYAQQNEYRQSQEIAQNDFIRPTKEKVLTCTREQFWQRESELGE